MNRHELDWLSLLGGLLFLGLGALFLLDALGHWAASLAWVPPIVLIVFGAAGVLSTLARHRRLEPAPTTATANPQPSPGFGEKPPENGG
jgi:hypothetical protein